MVTLALWCIKFELLDLSGDFLFLLCYLGGDDKLRMIIVAQRWGYAPR